MINIERIKRELSNIPYYRKHSQIMLQGVEGQTDPFYGTGKISQLQHEEKEFIHPIFDSCPYLNEVIKELGMYRTRILTLGPKSCYSYHNDPTKRIHIPIETHPIGCFMVVEEEVIRMPANGNYYVIDTTKHHTAVNADIKPRIHIVGIV